MTQDEDFSMGEEEGIIVLNDGELPPSIYTGDPAAETLSELRKDLSQQQEATRSQLAACLTFIFGGSVLLIFIYTFAVTFWSKETDTAKDLITLTFSSLTTIVGTALGFYFGSRTK